MSVRDNTTKNDFKRSSNVYTNGASHKNNLYNLVYVGKVKENKDAKRMGRIKVFVPELCGDPDDSTKWISAMYVSPFAGSTPINRNKVDGETENTSQTSYGMWMIPPDLENDVVIMFINGQPNRGVYIGSLYQFGMNNSVPGPVATPSQQDGVKMDGQEINPPTVEYNRRDGNQDTENPVRPRNDSLHAALFQQGVYGDPDRGPSNASARREAPSQVFGMSTPRGHHISIDDGEIEVDPTTGDPIYNDSSIVRKSLTNEYIRMRTRNGTQVLINDTLGYVYINSRLGNSWFELSDDGISMYTAKNFNVRCQGDMNIRVDGNLNQEVIGITNWRNGGNFNGQYESDMNLSIIPGGASSGGANELRISAKGEIFVNSDDSITLDGRNAINHKANRIIHSANRIDKNSFSISGGKPAAVPETGATRDRALTSPGFPEGEMGGGASILPPRGLATHEPWNYHQRIGVPNTSEASIGNVARECPPQETLPSADQNTPQQTQNLPGNPTETTPTVPPANDPRIQAAPLDRRNQADTTNTTGNVSPKEIELRNQANLLKERAARDDQRAQAARDAGNTQEAIRIQEESNRVLSQGLARMRQLSREIEADNKSTDGNTAGRIQNTAGRNPNAITGPVSEAINRGQALAANVAGPIVQTAGRINQTARSILDETEASIRAAVTGVSTEITNIGGRVLDPGIQTFNNIVPNYTQDLERGTITLNNGAVLTDALKPVQQLGVSDGMLSRIRSEYPFRDTATTIKETGTKIIGYGTVVTEQLASQFTNGVTIATSQAEELFRGRISEVEDVIKSSVNVPMTQNQFDSVVSLGEHIGPQELQNSEIIPAINSGNVQGAINEFECYTDSGRIGSRRRAEAGTYANGGAGSASDNSGSGFTPAPIEGTGRLTKGIPGDVERDAIEAAVQRTGVSREAMYGFAGQESAFNSKAKAGTSSAKGLYQFTDPTWGDFVKKYGDEYGLTPDGQYDPYQNAMAGALYMKENQRLLERKLDRPVTTTDLYAAHFLGPGGSQRILKAPPTAIAAEVALPAQVRANRSVFYDKSGRARTVDELYQFMQQKVEAPGITYAETYPPGRVFTS